MSFGYFFGVFYGFFFVCLRVLQRCARGGGGQIPLLLSLLHSLGTDQLESLQGWFFTFLFLLSCFWCGIFLGGRWFCLFFVTAVLLCKTLRSLPGVQTRALLSRSGPPALAEQPGSQLDYKSHTDPQRIRREAAQGQQPAGAPAPVGPRCFLRPGRCRLVSRGPRDGEGREQSAV